MPYKSDKQRKFFHSKGAKEAGITKKMVKHWDKASKGKDIDENNLLPIIRRQIREIIIDEMPHFDIGIDFRVELWDIENNLKKIIADKIYKNEYKYIFIYHELKENNNNIIKYSNDFVAQAIIDNIDKIVEV